MREQEQKYNKHNDACWCGRFVWAVLGLTVLLMDPSAVKDLVAQNNKALIGIMFLMVALMHHVLYLERRRTREMLKAITETKAQESDSTQQAN